MLEENLEETVVLAMLEENLEGFGMLAVVVGVNLEQGGPAAK